MSQRLCLAGGMLCVRYLSRLIDRRMYAPDAFNCFVLRKEGAHCNCEVSIRAKYVTHCFFRIPSRRSLASTEHSSLGEYMHSNTQDCLQRCHAN